MPGVTIERGPFDNGAHGGPVTAHDGIVEHVTTNWADPGPYFSQPINQASSHFWLRQNGEIVQFLPLEVASWAQAAGNYSYVSVETDGVPEVALSDAQVLAFAAVYRFVETAAGLGGFGYRVAEMPGQPGLGWHGMGGAAWGGHLQCPGDIRKAQRGAILYLAGGAAPAVTVPPAIYPSPTLTAPLVDWHMTGFFPAGALLLTQDGAIWTLGNAQYAGGANTLPAFAGRTAARFGALTDAEVAAKKLYVVLDTVAERYAFPA